MIMLFLKCDLLCVYNTLMLFCYNTEISGCSVCDNSLGLTFVCCKHHVKDKFLTS